MPAPGTAYGIPYITLSNIAAASTATGNGFTVTFETDSPCICALDYYPQDGRLSSSPSNNGTQVDGGAVTKHSLTVTFSDTRNAGQSFGFRIRLDASDVSGLNFRPYIGSLRLGGARVRAAANVPVRFYSFSGPMDGAVPAAGQKGNWSTYTWSQWNSKST